MILYRRSRIKGSTAVALGSCSPDAVANVMASALRLQHPGIPCPTACPCPYPCPHPAHVHIRVACTVSPVAALSRVETFVRSSLVFLLHSPSHPLFSTHIAIVITSTEGQTMRTLVHATENRPDPDMNHSYPAGRPFHILTCSQIPPLIHATLHSTPHPSTGPSSLPRPSRCSAQSP